MEAEEAATPVISQDSVVVPAENKTFNCTEDIAEWWNSLTELLKSCFTATRVDLEVNKDDPESLKIWSISSASDILSSGDGKCRSKVMRYVADDLLGMKIFLENMQEVGSIGVKKRESFSKVLRELVNPKHGKLRSTVINQVIALNYIPTSIKILKELLRHRSHCKIPEEMENVESTLVHFLWFFSAVATNDSSFAPTVLNMLKVKFFHNEVYKKIFFAKTSAHYPLLKILRQLSRHDDTAALLGKEGVMNTIRKTFTVVGLTPNGKLIILMDMLSQLTKKKTLCTRFLKAGLLIKVMQCFGNWELWRGKGLLRLSRFLISIYNHISRTTSGRKAIIKCDAIFQIRKFCDACPAERTFDVIIIRIAGLVATCYKKNKLPIDSLESPFVFKVPEDAAGKVQECGSSSDDEGSEDEDDNINSENGSEDEIIVSSEDEGENNDDEEVDKADGDKNDDSDDEIRSPLDITRKNNRNNQMKLLTRRASGGDQQSPLPPLIKTKIQQSNETNLINYKKFFPEFELTKQGLLNHVVTERGNPISKSLASLLDENLNETIKVTKPVGLPKSEHSYTWISEQKECQYAYWNSMAEVRRQYAIVANSINHVAPFEKIAYPDIVLGYSLKSTENLLPNSDRSTQRNKIIAYISRTVGCESFKPKVVYSLDNLLINSPPSEPKVLKNRDEKEIGIHNKRVGLEFESRFECGNLRKAIQIGEREYDLIISSDVNSRRHNQWFYFQVKNTLSDKMYTFNIINCTKSNSLFNYGMQPVYFSVAEAVKGRPGWIRSGSGVCYYKNGYQCLPSKKRNCKVYHTLTFNLTFPHKGDIIYIAYHLPYTYTRLMVELGSMIKATEERKDIVFKYDTLCQTLNKNDVPLLTITAQLDERSRNNRQIIFLTARVHPGETNSSWVMKGILEFLLFGKTSHVETLLKKYVFKIVPMLNVEGVINGCHRCGLTSEDLNRCWKSPSEILHPTIFHTKMLIEFCCKNLNLTPALYCDLHGHSRRKNLFFYGCSVTKSWHNKDKLEPDDTEYLLALPESMDRISPAFCLQYCNFDVKKTRETTARVAVWRDYGIPRSYTLECSYCGCDRGPYKGAAFGTTHLLEIGKDLCKAFLEL